MWARPLRRRRRPLRLCAPAPTAVVRADPRRLRQVVDGLAENALRVTPAWRAARRSPPGYPTAAWLQVRDGGPGLAPDDYAVVFDRGVLHERYRGRRPVGSGGVGLALVHGLVVRMGARSPPNPRRGRGLLHRHVPGRRPHSQAVNCTIRIALPKGSRRPKSVP